MAISARPLWQNEVFLTVTNRQTYVSASGEKVFIMPTRVLVELPSYKIVAFGHEARPVEHAGIRQARVMYPASEFEIFDEEASVVFVRAVMQMVLGKSFLLRPKVYLSQPSQLTPFMQELWSMVLYQAGAREVSTIHPLLSTAVGVGLPLGDSHGYAVGWWDDDQLILGLVAFGHVQYEQSYPLLQDQPRADLARSFATAWQDFLNQLPQEFRLSVGTEGGVVTIDNEDPLLAAELSTAAGAPIIIVPRSVELLGMKQYITYL
jgi:rod shape-determining protein MreB